MPGKGSAFEAIVRDVEHDGLSFDVRCFLVRHDDGVVLIDTGLPRTVELIAGGLERLGARWDDITDIVLTHKHFDHTASLAETADLAGDPDIWAGAGDIAEIAFDRTIRPLAEGDRVRDLRVVATAGHTPGHCSLIHEPEGLMFTGDIVGTLGGVLSRSPEQFTEDAAAAERTLRRVAAMDWEGRMVFSHGAEVADPIGDLRRLLAGGATPA